MTPAGSPLVLAANNAEVGGGEVMLLATARVLAGLGLDVEVVGPHTDGGVLDAAEAAGHPVHRMPAARRAYVPALHRWAARHEGWLWCHGLVPAFATAGRRRRIVHLHQEPVGVLRHAARLARLRADAVLVPSHHLAARVAGAEVLANWTEPVAVGARPRPDGAPLRVGFLGRHSHDKGLDVLADALALLDAGEPGRWHLVVAGDDRFVPDDQRAAVRAALGRVAHLSTHLGWVPPAGLLGAVDVAVFPSVFPESFGLVAAEAMSARVPVVVSDAGALPEVVGPGHPWVARAGDAADLARVVGAWAATPAAQVAAAVEAAHHRWEHELSPAAGAERVAALTTRLGLLVPPRSAGPGLRG